MVRGFLARAAAFTVLMIIFAADYILARAIGADPVTALATLVVIEGAFIVTVTLPWND